MMSSKSYSHAVLFLKGGKSDIWGHLERFSAEVNLRDFWRVGRKVRPSAGIIEINVIL